MYFFNVNDGDDDDDDDDLIIITVANYLRQRGYVFVVVCLFVC